MKFQLFRAIATFISTLAYLPRGVMRFENRTAAGQLLAAQLHPYANRDDVIVLALPRGGVPVGFEVAKGLNAALDILVVRKLGVPGHEELAMGAIAPGGVQTLNHHIVLSSRVDDTAIMQVIAQEQQELARREQLYRSDRSSLTLRDRTVILVDDGLATGATMRVAVQAVRQQQPARIVVAVPVAAPETCQELGQEVDQIICAETPQRFSSVGSWYEDFSQTTDEEVRTLLKAAIEFTPSAMIS
ncbi:phosphoribosyltransferase [Pantanalinema sp. GBBB05]|uniref:phosphoribosyltransferase n=1 Tax=Pantanalinema sp. GBBB05 TaxID=2604139 RepID=UPI003D817619